MREKMKQYIEKKEFEKYLQKADAEMKVTREAAKTALLQVKSLCRLVEDITRENVRLENENNSLKLRIDALQRQIITNAAIGSTPRANGAKVGANKTHPELIRVSMSSVSLYSGIRKALPNRKWTHVQFYQTDVGHVLLAKFLDHYEDDSAPIFVANQGGTWEINSIEVVNAVFGGVKIGAPNKYYSAELVPGRDDEFYVWPNTTAFVLGQLKPSVLQIITITAGKAGNKVVCQTNRMRISIGALRKINFTGNELFVEIDDLGPGEYSMKFSATPSKNAYALSPRKSLSVPYEICAKQALADVGYDAKIYKSSMFDADAIAPDTLKITYESSVLR